ncbi:hypothetical protein C8R43DRAFT_1124749 [Mycena crocata]|nr:hypothetical protein C8R43DRAFT_1124749 [Mycena crocata]
MVTRANSVFTTQTVNAIQLPFYQEKELLIRSIVEREVGHKVSLPSGMQFPKTNAPPKYFGTDDLDLIMEWIELLCSFMAGYLICRYEDGVDTYRVNMVKNHSGGAALTWFIINVSKKQVAGRPTIGFADVLCTLFKCFITTINAQRATRAFDLVQYDHAKGPEEFTELLITRANQMNNMPDKFVIHQRFLTGLPSSIRYKMRVDRELSAEYSSLHDLCKDARHFWSTMKAEEAVGATTGKVVVMAPKAAIVSAPRRPQLASRTPPVVACTLALVLARATPHTPAPAAPRAETSREDTRTCYKCGIYGHIGTNPICPQYSDGPVARGPRVHESYAEGDKPLGDEYAAGEAEEGDDGEGLWGGDQYDPDDAEEHAEVGADLAELVDGDTRMGAMQARYFALRIPEPEDEGESEATEEGRSWELRTDIHEMAVLNIDWNQVIVQGGKYPLWTAKEEARIAQSDPLATISSPTSFLSLLAAFEGRFGTAPLSIAQTTELGSIHTVGIEERALEVWKQLHSLQPSLLFGCPAAMLRTMVLDVELQGQRVNEHLTQLVQSRTDLEELASRRLDTLSEISRLRSLPSGINSQVDGNLGIASALNTQLTRDLHQDIGHLDTCILRDHMSAAAINYELTQRMLEREEYAQSLLINEEITYEPGTESSATLWEGIPDHGNEMSTVYTLKEDSGDLTVWISDSEDESPEVSVRAQQVNGNRPHPVRRVNGDFPQVTETYEYQELAIEGELTPDGPEIVEPERRVEETHEEASTTMTGHKLPRTQVVDRDPIAGEPPRLILRSIVMMGALGVEQIEKFLDAEGNITSRAGPLPEFHPANPTFRRKVEAAMDLAIAE